MIEENTTEAALLEEAERELLTDPEHQSSESRAELIEDLRDRIWGTFEEIEFLYMVLSDDEFREIFDGADGMRGFIRSRAQHAMAFLYYGLQLTDDDLHHRITSAIEEAESAKDRDATVTLDILTQPVLPAEQQIEAIENGNYEQLTAEGLDRLWYDERVSPEAVVDAFGALGEDELTVDDVLAEREGAEMFERMPAPVVTNVEPASEYEVESEN